jgi:hypothetical protein
MRYDSGTVDVPTAGTAVQVLNVNERVVWIRFSARHANTNGVYVGISDVSATNGRELRPPEEAEESALTSQTEYRPGDFDSTLKMDKFYVDADTNGNDIDWEAFFKDGE